MHSVFPERENQYNLRNGSTFKTENVRTTYYGTETLRYRGRKPWDIVPDDIPKDVHVGCVNYLLKKLDLFMKIS